MAVAGYLSAILVPSWKAVIAGSIACGLPSADRSLEGSTVMTKPGDSAAAFHGCGAAFYPEHCPPETWPEHIRLMKECGIRFVRLFEFAWSRFEPREQW